MCRTNTSPPLRHGAGLNHQLGGLGNGHEVARHVRVRHGHRPAGLDLLAEAAHDGARAVEHVAEADHGENGGAAARGLGLQHQLGQALARAHDVGRAHRLVGRDENDALDAVAVGAFGQHAGAEYIVGEADDGVLLDDRHVLVGGGVVARSRWRWSQ